MTSKISANKISLWTLMREDLRHRTWMIALSLLGSFLASPVAFLLFTGIDGRRSMMIDLPLTPLEVAGQRAANLADYLLTGDLIFQMIILYAGAAIVALFGFRYLYSRRMVDLYHSAPVTRTRLFLAQWLNGFIIWFVPFLAGCLCVYVIALFQIRFPSCFGPVTAVMVKMILLCTLCFLIIYNACLVAVMVSGNIMNVLVNMILYGLIVLAAFFTITGYMSFYYDTAFFPSYYFTNPLIIAFSPFASPVYLGNFLASGTPLGEWAAALLLSAALTAVNFLLALKLYEKRQSELAERGLEAKRYRIPARFVTSYLGGLLLAVLFDSVTHMGGWCLFGAVFGTALVFAVMNIIYHGGFKYFTCHRIQFLACLLFTCGTIGFFRYDVIGYDTYLPKERDITGLSICSPVLQDNSVGFSIDENGAFVRDYTYNPPGDLVFSDSAAIHRLLEALIPQDDVAPGGQTPRSAEITLKVSTRHGSYYRRYKAYNTEEDKNALRAFVETDAFREYFYPDTRADWILPSQLTVESFDDIGVTIKDRGQIERLFRCWQTDYKEKFTLETASSAIYYASRMCIRLEYRSSISTHTVTLGLSDNYERTISLLQEWYPELLWSRDDLEITSLFFSFHPPDDWKYGTAEQEQRYIRLKKEINDPAELERWKPYITCENLPGTFTDINYANCGSADYIRKDDPEKTFAFTCYIDYNNVPKELWATLEVEDESVTYDKPATAELW